MSLARKAIGGMTCVAVALPLALAAQAPASPAAQPPTQPPPFEWTTERPLAWTDFLGAPNASSTAAALTAYEMRTRVLCSDERPSYSVTVHFLPEHSWVKPNQQLDRTLAHEQGHFDLGEVTARRLREELTALDATCGAPSPKFRELLAEHQRKDADLQRSYDRQTMYGTDTMAQRRWERQIESWLRSIKP